MHGFIFKNIFLNNEIIQNNYYLHWKPRYSFLKCHWGCLLFAQNLKRLNYFFIFLIDSCTFSNKNILKLS